MLAGRATGILIAALAEVAGYVWSDRLEQDWTVALDAMVRAMIRGAESAQREAA